MLSRFLRVCVVLALALGLTGCIEVDYIGDSWEKAVLDAGLEGEWLMQQADSKSTQSVETYVFIKIDNYYSVYPKGEESDPMFAKTLQIGAHSFLLLREPVDPQLDAEQTSESGALWLYKNEDDGLQFLSLKQDKTDEIENAGGGLIALRQTGMTNLFGMERLNESTLKALETLADDVSSWEVWASGKKIVPVEEKKP